MVFISDGNPNQQTGTGGNSLADSTATAWNNFIDSNGITVTTIGIGDGMQLGVHATPGPTDQSAAPPFFDRRLEAVRCAFR